MNTNVCSLWTYEEIKNSGQIGKMQAMFMYIFAEAGDYSLTTKHAMERVKRMFNVKINFRHCGRVTELRDMGLIESVGFVKDPETRKKVNLWKWTGRKTPRAKVTRWVDCAHCRGKGRRQQEVYVDNKHQTELFT